MSRPPAARPGERQRLDFRFNPDASQIWVEAPPPGTAAGESPAVVVLETAEKTAARSDGRVIFSARDAEVAGRVARLESHPGNHRIGFWRDASDRVKWAHRPGRWGRYDVELTFSAAGGEGTQIGVELAGQTLALTRGTTGSWYRYTTVPAGRVYLEDTRPFNLEVSCRQLLGAAVFNLKAVTLRPAPEGAEVVLPAAGGNVEMDARDATVHGVKLRYEPNPKKLCLGYWSNPGDWASWVFALERPGRYAVEVHQGCGRGHGGSNAVVEVGGRRFPFVVEDTGGFQKFVPRRVGEVDLRPGRYRLAVRAVKKKAGAVMDIRRVVLVPLEG